MEKSQVAGLYIHFPFCGAKCPYCHFYSVPYKPKLVEAWLSTLEKEASILAAPGLSFDTIYLGGGTPSLIGSTGVIELRRFLDKNLQVSAQEFTLEANPGITSINALKKWKEAGVNRISLGVQSFDDKILKLLGRDYTSAGAEAFYHSLRRVFDNISIDLMIGVPFEDKKNAPRTLKHIRKLQPEHVSLYILENLEGLPYEAVARKNPVDDDSVADEYDELVEGLKALGFVHYEISNFARPGRESRHNLKYWRYEPFLGLGPSACSHLGDKRWCNQADLKAWQHSVGEGEKGKSEVVELSPAGSVKEAIIFGLRLIDGINLSEFKHRFGVDIVSRYAEAIAQLRRDGLIVLEKDGLRISQGKLLVSNQILSHFI